MQQERCDDEGMRRLEGGGAEGAGEAGGEAGEGAGRAGAETTAVEAASLVGLLEEHQHRVHDVLRQVCLPPWQSCCGLASFVKHGATGIAGISKAWKLKHIAAEDGRWQWRPRGGSLSGSEEGSRGSTRVDGDVRQASRP